MLGPDRGGAGDWAGDGGGGADGADDRPRHAGFCAR